MATELETAFHGKMLEVYDRAKLECRYTATRFRQMVNENGGLQAAKMLLASKHHPEGLTRLWEEGRLDISMEALILRHPWSELFSEEELSVARKRLKDLGYTGS
jgi:hypothetical protein